jgi:hypothetical protein
MQAGGPDFLRLLHAGHYLQKVSLRGSGMTLYYFTVCAEVEDYFEKTAVSNFLIRAACSSSCV